MTWRCGHFRHSLSVPLTLDDVEERSNNDVKEERHVEQITFLMNRHIAVLGGGISGLSSAFHLSRRFPEALVTLIEQTNLGGWISSERVHVRDDHGHSADILLESGPRTLRPNAKSILELVRLIYV